MAKKTPAQAPAQAPVAPTVDLALLTMIAGATAVTPHFANVSAEQIEPLRVAGLVEVNPDAQYANAVGPAVRISAAGTQYLASQSSPFGAAAPAAAVVAAPVAPKPVFTVASFALPEAKRLGGGGGARPEVYPFSKLTEVGQAFFIPATDAKPNPAKIYASTVTSATQRYATDDTSKPQVTNRKGNLAYPKIYSRKFAIRPISLEQAQAMAAAGQWPAAWGSVAAGAAVGRVPV